ncbi:MAG: hypothetical protein R3F20_00765 [Planctomycetota bacterium]
MRAITLGIALGLGLMALTAPAQDQDEKKFRGGLRSLERLVDKGEFDSFDERLLKLLEEHAQAPYAKAARGDVEALLLDRTIRGDANFPTLAKLLGGTIEKADEKKQFIKITYTPDDYVSIYRSNERNVRFLTPFFSGKHEIELQGKDYPEGEKQMTLLCLYDTDNQRIAVCAFGTDSPKGGGKRMRGGIYEQWYEKKKTTTLVENEDGGKAGKPWKLKVTVDDRKIRSYLNGKKYLEADRREDWNGAVGFRHDVPWTKVSLEGVVDPVKGPFGLLQAQRQTHEAAVRKSFDPKKTLPDWLYQP